MDGLKTKWIVLTGAPNSGKSSTLERLSFLGYKTVPESARLYIDQETSTGRAYQDLRSNEHDFQTNVFALNHEVAQRFPPNELFFFDRGLGDSAAYFNIHGMDPAPALDAARKIKYNKIFLLDRLLRKRDEGMGDEHIGDKIEDALIRAYNDLGYDIVRIPVASVADRTTLILQHLDLDKGRA